MSADSSHHIINHIAVIWLFQILNLTLRQVKGFFSDFQKIFEDFFNFLLASVGNYFVNNFNQTILICIFWNGKAFWGCNCFTLAFIFIIIFILRFFIIACFSFTIEKLVPSHDLLQRSLIFWRSSKKLFVACWNLSFK